MRRGYNGYYEGVREYERMFPKKCIPSHSQQLLGNRLVPGTYEGCRVYLKEKGKGSLISIGFEHKAGGKFLEQMAPEDAMIFTPNSLWILTLIAIGDVYIAKSEGTWSVFRAGISLYRSSAYNACKHYIESNGLELYQVVIDTAQEYNYV